MAKPSQLSLISEYYKYYKKRKYVLPIASSVVLMLVTMVISLVTPYIPRYAIDNILPAKDFTKLWQLAAAVAMGLVAREISKYFYTTQLMAVKERVRLNVMNDLARAIYQRNFKFFDSTQTGYLCSRVLADVKNLASISLENLLNIFFSVLFVVAAIGYLFWMDAFLALLIVISICLGGGTTWFPKDTIKKRSMINSENWAQVNAHLQERLMGIRTTKLFDTENLEIEKFGNIAHKAIAYLIKFNKVVTFYSKTIILVASTSLVFTLVVSFGKVMNGTMSLGACISFFMYASMVFNLATYIFVEIVSIRTTSGPLERISDILNHNNARPEIVTHSSSLDFQFDSIEFGRVSFDYNTDNHRRQDPILKNISFEAILGERIAIIGETGSGKSSIGKLAAGMYAPVSGIVHVGRYDIGTIPESVLRKNIGLVTQDKFLFRDSILENIRYGAPWATFEDVVRVSKIVKLHEFISTLDNQYDTMLSELADNISEGQKQRLAIARALIQKYKILIFDEITSHIDLKTEKFMIDKIFISYPVTIQIYLTHSLHLLKLVDRIIHLEHGEIIEIGHHFELYDRSEKYRGYYQEESKRAKRIESASSLNVAV